MGRILAWTATLVALALTLLAQLDRLPLGAAGWWFDLLAQFTRHLMIAALLATGFAFVLRQWKAALAGGAALAISLASFLLVPPFAQPAPPPPGAALIRIASANVHESPEALAKLADMARIYGADVISTYETPDLSRDALHRLFPDYATSVIVRQTPNGKPLSSRILVVARAELGPIDVVPVGANYRAFLRYRAEVDGGAVQMTAVHTVAPGYPRLMIDRNLELAALGEGLDRTRPFLVFGDFNTTPFAAAYARAPGVRAGDPRSEGTFPAQLGAFGLPIDHIRFGGGLALAEHHVGPGVGSDHLPVFATFALPAGPPISPLPASR